MTHTCVVLELSREAYNEIHDKLVQAGYDHAIDNDGLIDMHTIAVQAAEEAPTGDRHG